MASLRVGSMGTNLTACMLLPLIGSEPLRCGTVLPEPGEIILLLIGLGLLLFVRRRRHNKETNSIHKR